VLNHQNVAFDKTMTAAVDGEIKDLAHWLELDLTLGSSSHRQVSASLLPTMAR
jgi:hypothetical protein